MKYPYNQMELSGGNVTMLLERKTISATYGDQ